MFLGMAVAHYWDLDWEIYGKVENLYAYLLKQTDFDHMDDYICESVLNLSDASHRQIESLVGECAARCYHRMLHPIIALSLHCMFFINWALPSN